MKTILALVILFQALSALASPSCLADKSCMEYNGQIIDLKPRYLKNLGLSSIPTETPLLTGNEFKKIVGEEGAEYFIPVDLNGSDLAILAGALSLGTVVFKNDREIMDIVQANKHLVPDGIGDFGSSLAEDREFL